MHDRKVRHGCHENRVAPFDRVDVHGNVNVNDPRLRPAHERLDGYWRAVEFPATAAADLERLPSASRVPAASHQGAAPHNSVSVDVPVSVSRSLRTRTARSSGVNGFWRYAVSGPRTPFRAMVSFE